MKELIKFAINNYHFEIEKSFIHSYLSEIYRYEKNELMKLLIKEVIFLNKNYLLFIDENFISESTFFRLKNQLIDKIYHLLILDNKVTREEILND